MDVPDKYTAAHCIRQVQGFGVLLNGLASEQRDQNEVLDALKRRIESLEAARLEDMAMIGKVTAWMEEMERIRKSRNTEPPKF